MESVRETQKKYGSRAMAAAIIIGFLFILAGRKGIGKGLVLGTLFSVLNFVLMGEMLPLRIGKSASKTYILSFCSICLRYILLAVPLVLAIKFEQINLYATIFGIFMIQLAIVADHFFRFPSLTRKS